MIYGVSQQAHIYTTQFPWGIVDCGTSVQQTSDGGYIIAGYINSHVVGGGDVWLIKTDAQGNQVW
ncbi:MAG: hypothetical protein FJY65_10715 [Calditrichaeota bacterium]|nr:hypothetical protein [Calditrichota bacterium]